MSALPAVPRFLYRQGRVTADTLMEAAAKALELAGAVQPDHLRIFRVEPAGNWQFFLADDPGGSPVADPPSGLDERGEGP